MAAPGQGHGKGEARWEGVVGRRREEPAETCGHPSPANQTPPSVIGVSNVGSNDNNTDDSIMLPALVEFPTPPRAKRALEVVIEKDNVMTAGTPAGVLAAKMTAFPTPADGAPPSVIDVGAVELDSDDVDDSIRLPAWRSGRRSW